jgi:hypothetical protein
MREGRDERNVNGSTPGTNNGMGMSASAIGAVTSTRDVDPTTLKIDAALVQKQRIVFLNTPEEISGVFDTLMSDKSVRLATAGYSAAPNGYEEPTTHFLSDLVAALGDDVGLITSPTCDKGSIDAITSTVGQRAGATLGYVTADSYLAYIKPDSFPTDIDREVFGQQLKFAFPDPAVYSRATAVLSNSFLVTGGRNASVNDFMNAIEQGNKVIVLLNEKVSSPAWDPAKSRVDDAAEYLFRMIQGNYEGIPLDNEFNARMKAFVEQHKEGIRSQVLFVNAMAEGAVAEAVEHLTKPGGAVASHYR